MVLLESQVTLKKGDKAPDFNLLGIDDKKHSLDEFKGKDGLLVVFMCNHCPYVKAKIEALKEIHQKYGDKIAMLGINSNDTTEYPDDSFDNMKKVAQENGIKFHYLIDETQEVAKRYGAVCTPDPFLFDKDFNLVYHGKIDDAMSPEDTPQEKTMIQNIEKLLNGQPVEKDFDPSRGCSIKWKK